MLHRFAMMSDTATKMEQRIEAITSKDVTTEGDVRKEVGGPQKLKLR